jgi:hypothetical protein
MARGMAAGEKARTLRVHGALRSSGTCGEVSDRIVGERPPQVKADESSSDNGQVSRGR